MSNGINHVMMVGRIARAPEERAGGACAFSIAVERKFKREGQPDTDFFDCIAFGNNADFIRRYVLKGSLVSCIGSMEHSRYTNRNGEKVTGISLVVSDFTLLAGPRERTELVKVISEEKKPVEKDDLYCASLEALRGRETDDLPF